MKLKKKSGFTLIEVLVSLVLLTFVILISSTLFDKAIQNTPKIKQAIDVNNEINSRMDKAILQTKEDMAKKNIKDIPEYAVNFDIGGIHIDKIKGYFISESVDFDSTGKPIYNSKIANTNKSDRLSTFIGYGSEEMYDRDKYIAKIQNIYLNGDSRFIFRPMEDKNDANEEKLKFGLFIDRNTTNYFVGTNVTAVRADRFNDADKKSPRILTPYVDDGKAFSVSDESFRIYFDANRLVPKEKILDKEEIYKFPYYGKFDSTLDRKFKKEYFDSVDTNYIVQGFTMNKGGDKSLTVKSIDYDITGRDRQKTLYLIGIPSIDGITDFYDMNLAISKSNIEDGKYYSMFDQAKIADIKHSGFLDRQTNDKIYLKWDGKDMIDFTEPVDINQNPIGRSQKNIDIEDGATFIKSDEYNHQYGNSIYLNTEKGINFKLNDNKGLFIIKFNSENYKERYKTDEENTGKKYFLLSYNLGEDGEIDSESFEKIKNTPELVKKAKDNIGNVEAAFGIYVDENGDVYTRIRNIKYDSKTKKIVISDYNKADSKIQIDKKEHGGLLKDMNLLETNLYKNLNDVYARKKIDYDSNMKGRENFNIVGIFYDKTSRENSTEFKVYLFDNNNIDYLLKNAKITAGRNMYYAPNVKDANLKILSKFDENKIIEVSDILYYIKDMTPINNEHEQNIKRIMNYLYYRYLTPYEQDEMLEYLFTDNIG